MKRRNSGFTLVEIMITVTIMGILSATVALSISNYVLERRGEERVVAFYSMLQQMRGYAQRNNVTYDVILAPVNLHTNTAAVNSTFEIQVGGAVIPQLFPNQASVTRNLRFVSNLPAAAASATNRPFTPPDGWGTGNTSRTIRFQNDEIGTISPGVLYLQNTNTTNIYYAIIRQADRNYLNLYKWNGRAWDPL